VRELTDGRFPFRSNHKQPTAFVRNGMFIPGCCVCAHRKLREKLEQARPSSVTDDTDPSRIFSTEEQLQNIHSAMQQDRTTSTVVVEIGRPSDPRKTGTTGMPEITALLVSAWAMGYEYVCIVDDPRFNKDGWPLIDLDINGFITCSQLPESERLRHFAVHHVCVSYTSRDWKKSLDKAEFAKWSAKLRKDEQENNKLVVLSCALRDVHRELPVITRFIQDIAENKCVIIVRNFLRASVYARFISSILENRASACQFLENCDVPLDLLQPDALARYRSAMKQVARLPFPMFILQCPWFLTPCEVLKATGDIQTPFGKRMPPLVYVSCTHRGVPLPPRQEMLAWTVPTKRCEYCLRSEGPLQRCGHCGAIYYCGRACQKKHWPRHKPKCMGAADTSTTAAFFEQLVERLDSTHM
jgi:hypothetical protein